MLHAITGYIVGMAIGALIVWIWYRRDVRRFQAVQAGICANCIDGLLRSVYRDNQEKIIQPEAKRVM